MATLLPNWPVLVASIALVLILAENALGVTGLSLFTGDGSDGEDGGGD